MKISIIVAAAENGVIGRKGRLPWHLPDDLMRFKRLTTGHPVIMGRKTHESIGRPLPDRQNLVLTRSPDRSDRSDRAVEGVEMVDSFETALERARGAEVFVIGGEALFSRALEIADRIHLTLVHAEVDGDVHFPLEALAQWMLADDERHAADDRHAYDFSFRIYERA